MKASSSEPACADNSCKVIPACPATSPICSMGAPVTSTAPLTSLKASPALASAVRRSASCGERTRTEVRVERAMKSAVEESAINLPRPMTMRWSAVSAISDSRCDDTRTVRPWAARFFMNVRIQ